MDSELRKQLELHSAGATVQHAAPYSNLEVPSSRETPSEDFIKKWIIPFYMWGIKNPDEFIERYSPIRQEVDRDLISSLLIWFNWRSRIVGAYFAAIESVIDASVHIGRLLLRSDVCYAGEGYALALATFNSEQAIEFLKKYLDYYLTKRELEFDQGSIMAAIAHLDRINGTSIMDGYLPKWEAFIADNPYHSLNDYIEDFERQIDAVKQIAKKSI